MANSGAYGTNIPVRIDTGLTDIFYSYSESRDNSGTNTRFKRLSSNILEEATYEGDAAVGGNILEGLYNLKLPIQYFSKVGFYTVYIKPKEIAAVIEDVANLSTQGTVRGIVLDSNKLTSDIRNLALTNNGLVGFRVIYINDDGTREPYFRLVTSNNKCEPVIQTTNSSTVNGYSYRFNESSTTVFLTLTPSSAPSFRSSASPFIGKVGQKILLVSTDFEPVMLDIEITDKDINSLSTILEGNQVRDLDNGLVTTFDENGNVLYQTEHYTLKENGVPIYEVRKNREGNIDFTQTLEDKL